MTLIFRILIILQLVSISSCVVNLNRHGYVFENSHIDELVKGKTTKVEVIELIGSPSVISTFDRNIWYYISNETKQISIFKPKNTHQEILQITFKDNVINTIYLFKDDEVRSLGFSKDETPVRGDDTGIVKDFVQNFGRFNKSVRAKKD